MQTELLDLNHVMAVQNVLLVGMIMLLMHPTLGQKLLPLMKNGEIGII